MKRIIFIIFSILLVIIIILLVYLGWQSFTDTPLEEVLIEGTTSLESEGQESLLAGLTLVSEEVIKSYWINRISGDPYLINEAGQIIGITTQTIDGINEILPSSDGRRAIVHFGHPNRSVFTIFDADSKSWSPLPKGTVAAAWHPKNSNKIIYLNTGGLKLFDFQDKKSSSVLRVNFVDALLAWPTENKVLVSDRASASYEGVVWEIDIKNKTLKKVVSGNGLIIKQSDKWQLKFTGSKNSKEDRFILTDAISGKELADIDALLFGLRSVTLPSKCVFNKNKIYCAVPQQIPPTVVLPDDYQKRSFYSKDDIYLINIDTELGLIKTKLLFASEQQPIDAINLIVSGNKLYFINRHDQRLYKINL